MSLAAPQAVASHRYFDRDLDRQAIKLLPTEYYVTTDDTALTTVLGSCVAACLCDPVAGIAGMNHFMLPHEGSGQPHDPRGAMRYGDYAMEVLLHEMLRAGARRERIEAKVFGGAAVLANMTALNIGDRNADFVLRYLQAHQLRLTAQDLRGTHARRIALLPALGKVLVRKLGQPADVQHVQRVEGELLRALSDPGAAAHAILRPNPTRET